MHTQDIQDRSEKQGHTRGHRWYQGALRLHVAQIRLDREVEDRRRPQEPERAVQHPQGVQRLYCREDGPGH